MKYLEAIEIMMIFVEMSGFDSAGIKTEIGGF